MIFQDEKGQSLIEVMVAIAIITTGVFSVWALFLSNFSGEQEARSRTVAANLAREGVEIVKNIRDSNWLRIDNGEDINWDEGLDGDGTAVIADLLAGRVILDYAINSLDEDGARLYLQESGFYAASASGQPTLFRRLVSLTPLCCSDVDPADLKCDDYGIASACEEGKMTVGYRVESAVRWAVNKKSRGLVAVDEIYNWR